MFHKVLALEAIVVIAMVGLFIHQQLPATHVSVGETTVVIKSPPVAEPVNTRYVPPATEEIPTVAPTAVKSIAAKGKLVFPVAGHDTDAVISVFGDKRGKTRLHKGIDIKAPRGTDVVAVADGFIERIKEGGSGGRQIYLRDGEGRLYFYAHLDDWKVEEFEAVKAGDVIGTVGDTGNAKNTTPHLHFEVMVGKDKTAVDPMTFWVQV